MADLDLIMQALALTAIVLYLLPRVIGGRGATALPWIGAALLTGGIIIALVQTFFWFSK
ncbi:hypothetical protein SAMN06265338_103134 [Rhodoblastus acidophilus]|uniref:Uncharacterized protein n=1 Tax=Rhodoblastus acidophilus TaxID=1074 RepID=A0A212R9H9_RHOAC|nr:hypothetical protein [Rhodoblastus acidophilus]SNB68879.1 hypothetical protein SAMN06265338_103134 [Rhodoblastus acidophilus]